MAERGHIVLTLLFVLLLSVSGLALLTQTGWHMQIIAVRKDKRLAAVALEQALMLYLHRYREKLAASDMNAFQEPESEFFNLATFPDQVEGGYSSRHQFHRLTLRDDADFRVVRIFDHVQTCRDGSPLSYAGRSGVDLFAGRVPASEPGLLVVRKGGEAPAAYLSARAVEYAGSQLPLVGDYALDHETGALLVEALRLQGQVPDWRLLREKINLEPSAAPIPPGIYLARDGKELAAIFVQGDLQRLEFSAGDGWQTVVFSRDGLRSELRYRPGQESVAWSGDDALTVNGMSFAEKIIVLGSVWDIRQAGAAAFLDAARIELLACGRLVVRSGLECENLALGKEKIPGLLLMTCDRDFFSGEAAAADIVIAATAVGTVQAQVLAAGALVNEAGSVEITGSLVASDIVNAGKLRVAAANGNFAFDDRVRLPEIKFLKNFRVHFIQEGSDE